MRRRTGVLSGVAASMCLIGAFATPATAAPPTPALAGVTASATTTTVTLITGDRVSVLGDGRVGMAAADRRPGIRYLITRNDGHTSVLPSDALPMVRAGRLDPRLFDVTELVASGSDDQHNGLGVIVSGAQATAAARGGGTAPAAAARSVTAAAGAEITVDLPALGAVAAHRPTGKAGTFWSGITQAPAAAKRNAGTPRALRPEIGTLWLDGRRQPLLDVSVPQISAPAAWAAGYTGAGVTVALLDTGIDGTHPDLAGKVVDHRNFTEGEEDDRDLVGHGTHVASTIAGTGAASGGKYRGVAPDAKLLDGKVCMVYGCAESWILAGMQWAAADQHARIISMSLGGQDGPGLDPLEQAVENLTASYGTLFVIAAGNSGKYSPVSSPASADSALAVGAVDDHDALAEFSSRGPRTGDSAVKPDVTAPGVDITAARGKDAVEVPGKPGDQYTTISGTSMATPHVSGAAAILLQQHPEATWSQLKAILMGTADPNPTLNAYQQGAGRIDLAHAIAATTVADPPSVSFGRPVWPHGDDPVATRTVTYRNSGTSDQVLTLDLTTAGPDDKPAPAGVFTMSATTLRVPAGGSASVTISADTSTSAPDGRYTGRITATGGPTALVTPFAVDKEVESYNLTLGFLNPTGAPASEYFAVVRSYDTGDLFDVEGGVDTVVRVPKGRYAVLGVYFGEQESDPSVLMVDPEIVIDKDRSMTMDGRQAKPMKVSVAGTEGQAVDSTTGLVFTDEASSFAAAVGGPGELLTGQVGGDRTVAGFYSFFQRSYDQPLAGQPAAAAGTAPDSTNVAWAANGKMFTGLDRTVRARDLASVLVDTAKTVTPATLLRYNLPSWSFGEPGFGSSRPVALPSRQTVHYNTDGGVLWRPIEVELTGPPEDPTGEVSEMIGPLTRYRAGRTVTEVWNRGVFGPALTPRSPGVPSAAVRTGDSINVVFGMFSDGIGREGYALTGTGSTTLLRNGTVVGSSDEPGYGSFPVPADAANYRLSVRAQRGAPNVLSTSVSADWTFRSAGAGTATTGLPLWAVTFGPQLADDNTAPARKHFVVPLTVAPQTGSHAGRLKELTVQVSYDDGATWRSARVVPDGDGRAHVVVDNSTGAAFVSLRAHAGDTAGNTLDQTIIHAYRIAGAQAG